MLSAVPRVLEPEQGSFAFAELLAVFGVAAWAVGLVWLAVHVLILGHRHGPDDPSDRAGRGHVRPSTSRRP